MVKRASAKQLQLWIALTIVSGVPRILASFLLPNAFGDAYAYIRDVGAMSDRLSAGTFTLTNLYGFWLPLYQFICAGLTLSFGHPFYVARLVSALFGTGVCLLVYAISLRLTAHARAALLAFALIAFSPLHIFNSASAMTDVPNTFFVLASLYFVLSRRWVMASVLAALAGLTRVDSWMMIALIPALQFLRERRVSVLACVILLFPPLFWFYISWRATGDWLACFVERKQYMDWLFKANPSLATFSLHGIARDAGSLLLSTDLAVLTACFVGAWLTLKHMKIYSAEPEAPSLHALLAINTYFFAFLCFIVLAYLTHKQPIIFPRYGLILFALGLPLLPWVFLKTTSLKPQWSRRLLKAVAAICLLNAGIQLAYAVGYINREYASIVIADYLRTQFQTGPQTHIFSDDGTVQAMSGISRESFLSSSDAPRTRQEFLNYLKEKNVEYLVFKDDEYSTPARLFPELKRGAGDEMFQPIMHQSSKFLPVDIWLYRLHP